MGSRNFKGIKILSNIVDLDDVQVGQLGEFIRDLPTGRQQVGTHIYDIQEGLVHVLPLKRKVELEMQACDQLEAMGFAIEIMLWFIVLGMSPTLGRGRVLRGFRLYA